MARSDSPSRDPVQEARDVLDMTMLRYADMEHPSREYPHNQRKYEADVADNREALDAFEFALRASLVERVVGKVEGMKNRHHDSCKTNTTMTGACSCGADAHNAALDIALAVLRAELNSGEGT